MLRTLLLLCLSGCAAQVVDVSQLPELGCTGVWRDPNPHTAVPRGALERAEEVVFRRKDVCEPRPGFKAGVTFADLDAIYKLIAYAGSYIAVGEPSGFSDTTYWVGDTQVTTAEAGDPLEWDRDAIRHQIASENLYLATSDQPRKLSFVSDTDAYRMGLPTVHTHAFVYAAGSVVAPNYYVAYRALVRRRDTNENTLRGAPSARAIFLNGSAGTVDALVFIHLSAGEDYVAGDVIEVYRSRTSSVSPRDELYLAIEHEITSTNISDGWFALIDDVVDDDLGQALYTNSSREGIERENVRPPLCTDMALYAGSLFCSRITWPHRMVIKWDESGDVSASATGIGTRQYTGTRTNASNVISGLSSTVGLKVGMIVIANASSWSGTASVRITAINGADLTMSETWGGATDGAPVSITFADTIRVSDGTQNVYVRADYATNFLRDFLSDTGVTYRVTPFTTTRAYGLGDSQLIDVSSEISGNRRTVVIERILPSSGSFQVWATHGDEYTPPLPEPSVASGEASAQDDFPNGITWSKADQPEHFMRGARWLVGKQDVPVLRILWAGDALWVLKGKGDGIYRLSGFGERSGWRVDQRSADTYLLHPELAVASDDVIYAWTNKGAVEISDRGIVSLSEPVLGAEFATLQVNLDHTASAPGAFAVVNEKDGEVIFGLPPDNFASDEILDAATRVWVLNTENKAWSQWFVAEGTEAGLATCAMYDPETRLISLGTAADGITRIEREPDDDFRNADLEYSVTVSAVDGTTVTINAGSGWTPAVGDLLYQPSIPFHYAIVTAITSATVFTVHDADEVATGVGTAYVHYQSEIEWLTKTAGNPAMVKRFRELIAHWEDTFGVYAWSFDFETTQYGAAGTSSHTRTYARTEDVADDTRTHIPRNARMGSRLSITLNIAQADSRWRFAGITLDALPAGRVGR